MIKEIIKSVFLIKFITKECIIILIGNDFKLPVAPKNPVYRKLVNGTVKWLKLVNGTVKWFNSKKGYGFVTPDDGSPDVFVHYSAVKAEEGEFKIIYEGDIVEFEVTEGQKGPQAVDVVVTQKGPRTNTRGRKSFY